jgi:hypothetical protein
MAFCPRVDLNLKLKNLPDIFLFLGRKHYLSCTILINYLPQDLGFVSTVLEV